MEVSIEGCFRAAVDHFSPEKRHTEQKTGENFVDELLDFSNEESITTEIFLYNVAANSTYSSTVTTMDSCNSSVAVGDENHLSFNIGSHGFADCQFSDDLAYELEWLSNFVEDSFSAEDERKTLYPVSGANAYNLSTKPQTSESSSSCETPKIASPLFYPDTPVPGKARSKRSRAAPGDWSTRLLHVNSPMPLPTATNATEFISTDTKPMHSESTQIKRRDNLNSDRRSGRKCLHCATEKTPQWRTGPVGAKTLCNACGVRYKSGRLVTEYRPAASPTFVSTKHSNSHRKVLELRRQRELLRQQQKQFLTQTSIFGVSNNGDEHLIYNHNGPDYPTWHLDSLS